MRKLLSMPAPYGPAFAFSLLMFVGMGTVAVMVLVF